MRSSLAVAVLVSSVGLAYAALPGHHPKHKAQAEESLTELQIKDVIPLSTFHQAAVILEPLHGDLIVPVLVGEQEGEALREQLKDEAGGKAEVLRQAIVGLGGKVQRVELLDLEGESVKAAVVVDQKGHQVSIAGPAASSLSVALAAKVPVMASQKVLDGLGLTRDQIRSLVDSAGKDEEHPSGSGQSPGPDGAPLPGSISL